MPELTMGSLFDGIGGFWSINYFITHSDEYLLDFF